MDNTAILTERLVSAAEIAALNPARPDPIIIISYETESASYKVILFS
ncbi:MAG TPA: hypothetical protein VJ799_07530 [Nitrososphaeraceae archaeon]|nr:hypothetical protein [Nitrososphaeraceae archaeon]